MDQDERKKAIESLRYAADMIAANRPYISKMMVQLYGAPSEEIGAQSAFLLERILGALAGGVSFADPTIVPPGKRH